LDARDACTPRKHDDEPLGLGIWVDDHNPRALAALGVARVSALDNTGVESGGWLQHSADVHRGHAPKGQLDELDVEGILRSQNVFSRAPATSGCRPRSISGSGSNNCSFQTESRSTEIALLEPAQLHRLSATCGQSEPKMKVWWT